MMLDAKVERLLTTLLYEGYALYPYTPGATKNATPTPFGIVYPPVYAAGGPHTFSRARMQVVLDPASPSAPVGCVVAFLEHSGERHQGVERRIALGPLALDELIARDGLRIPYEFDAVSGRVRMAATPLDGGLVRVAVCVHNTTPVEEGLDRAGALCRSLLSTHLVARAPGSRFASPIAPGAGAAAAVRECDHVNIFPVLASENDDTVLGATIVVPDHPQIAPESHGDLFDATEIEEALLLHVLALSDAERESIAQQDPKVREMLARADAAGPEEIARVRGRVTVSDLPPSHRPGPADVAGEPQIVVDGIVYRRGAKVVLRPEFGRAPQDNVWADRQATIERIYRDYEDGYHIAVTVDDDPGQELMRDIGRYLYFKPAEVDGPRDVTKKLEKQILIAGVGNAWLQDDAFGGEVARRLRERELPSGVSVMDVGTSGLDLAYEVMRGYSALVIVDVSKQGGEPGTLYVIDVDRDDVPAEIEDGESIDPHSMDPMTMLRFVRVTGGWPGRVQVIACEPAEVDEVGLGLTPAVEAAVDRAIALVLETVEELRTDAAYPAG